MGKNISSHTAQGSFDNVAPNRRIRIDPQLRDKSQNVIHATDIEISGGFLLVSNQDDPTLEAYGTFDVQNISEENQTLQWSASHLLHCCETQEDLGPRGSDPSPLPPIDFEEELPNDHNLLEHLGPPSDDHTQYAHLQGRGAGQTLCGGTNESGFLYLDSTSHNVKGPIITGSNLIPVVDNQRSLGAVNLRYKQIFTSNLVTGDLHLKDDKKGAHWTIIEESDCVTIKNQKTGKLFKFVLEEMKEEE